MVRTRNQSYIVYLLCRSFIQDNMTHLSKEHEYYTQIQGQLLINGCDFCEFIVYTHKDLFVQRVLPDLHFMGHVLEKLC